jgi:murein DD-endopeptidase MepM/ murein hydrolase activator NlpD
MISPKWVLLLWTLAQILPAEEHTLQGFPAISRLEPGDVVFKQYQADVEAARRRIANMERIGDSPDKAAEDLTVYAYIPREGDDVFSLAARCTVPYAALATLNRFEHPASMGAGQVLLLPSMPGLFIPLEAESGAGSAQAEGPVTAEGPATDLEQLLAASRAHEGGLIITLTRNNRKESFRFIPGADFSPTERAFFLNTGFRFPLRRYRLTSSFGLRRNPVTGTLKVHEGLDLAAPEGDEVLAARDGVVTDLGDDPIYGKYIVIRHGESWVSLYGHLSKIETVLRSSVRSGTLIGRVGSTGQSTGPHLHFELRQNGKAQDPGRFLFTR